MTFFSRNKFSLKNKTALITGAASGLGRSLAVLLSENDCHLILIDKDKENLLQTQNLIKKNSTTVSTHHIDLKDLKRLEVEIDDICGKMKVDMVINCAGFEIDGDIVEIPMEDLLGLQNVNLLAPLLIIKKIIPQLKKNKQGSIVNICSYMARRSVPGKIAYCQTKAGLYSLSEGLRVELASHNINVMTVMPGAMETGFAKNIVCHGRINGHFNQEEAKRTCPDIIAGKIIKNIIKKKKFTCIKSMPYYLTLFNQLFPKIVDTLFLLRLRSQNKKILLQK